MYERYMKLAFKLASLGRGFVSPNPLVGAVLVNQGRIVGIGYHRRYGEAHAEVRAIEDAGKDAQGAVLFVNLEPHHFYGKVPPCTYAILEAGISKVVVSNKDPNPKVNGKGLEFLRSNGVEVVQGILEEQGKRLNEVFFKWVSTGMPFVALKFAQTLDGFITTSPSRRTYISSEASLRYVHKLRYMYDAVAIGANTALVDDPQLTVRHYYTPKQPVKVIFDGSLRVWKHRHKLRLFREGRVILINYEQSFMQDNVQAVKVSSLEEALRKLSSLGITSMLVEGGASLLSQFLESKLFDKVYAFVSPKIFGRGLSAFSYMHEPFEGLKLHRLKRLGNDILAIYYKDEAGN